MLNTCVRIYWGLVLCRGPAAETRSACQLCGTALRSQRQRSLRLKRVCVVSLGGPFLAQASAHWLAPISFWSGSHSCRGRDFLKERGKPSFVAVFMDVWFCFCDRTICGKRHCLHLIIFPCACACCIYLHTDASLGTSWQHRNVKGLPVGKAASESCFSLSSCLSPSPLPGVHSAAVF